MLINEITTQSLHYKDEVVGAHSGQRDSRLTLKNDDKAVGYIEYTVLEKQPSINMIEVFEKGRGYGTRLVKRLQAMFSKIID